MSGPPRRRSGGLTLLELMIALAIAAILGAITLPSFGSMLQQRRLGAAAHQLAADLAEARQEAMRRGQAVQLRFGGAQGRWCYVLAAGSGDAPPPDCGAPGPVASEAWLKRVGADDHPGITLLDAQTMRLSPNGAAVAIDTASALLANARGEQLRVRLSRLGRAAVCAPAAPVAGQPHC